MKKDELLKGTGHLKDLGLSQGFKFWDEFKAFAFKGNMIDLAVAVILGGAFGAVINSLVKDIIMPALAYVLPGNQEYTKWTIGSAAKPVHVGTFLGEVVNFLIIALAVFVVIVKVIGALTKLAAKPAPAADPTTKECPYCFSTIPIKATRCPNCTSELPAAAAPAAPAAGLSPALAAGVAAGQAANK